MVASLDGPASPFFFLVPFQGNWPFNPLSSASGISEGMVQAIRNGPYGHSVGWGIPFEIGDPIILNQKPVIIKVEPFQSA
jgi:hypothetical protein